MQTRVIAPQKRATASALARRAAEVGTLTIAAFCCWFSVNGCSSGNGANNSSTQNGGGTAGQAGATGSAVTGNASGNTGGTGNPALCASDADCDDDRFCNGEELCDPDADEADDTGCVANQSPCDEACDEGGNRCVSCAEGDVDGDDHLAIECGGDDCDDNDGDRYPGNTEVCDSEGHDEDCDPDTVGGPSDADKDDDGFDDIDCCNELPDGELFCGTDCDDSKRGINPGSTESCNDIDDNCDGDIDIDEQGETLKLKWYEDKDEDGHGVTATLTVSCAAPETGSQWVHDSGDCLDDPDDERSGGINPGVAEVCDANGLDENCNGNVDEDCPCLPTDPPRPCGPVDEHGNLLTEPDGVTPLTTGRCARGQQSCLEGTWSNDCANSVAPSPEICTNADLGEDDDENCDGIVDGDTLDDDLKRTYYRDDDGDGHGVALDSRVICTAEGKYTARDGDDCVDDPSQNSLASQINPDAQEECNGYDDNCDAIIDGKAVNFDLEISYWRDRDGDQFGNPSEVFNSCSKTIPSGFTDSSGQPDCVDDPAVNSNAAVIFPSQDENCNGYDDNCDGIIDGVATNYDQFQTFWRDRDGDQYGNQNETTLACNAPAGYVVPGSHDCIDNPTQNSNASVINPGKSETCNGYDDNCDGRVDGKNVDYDLETTYFRDQDQDGYGNPNVTTSVCATNPPAGYVNDSTDCNDGDFDIKPGAEEPCNGVDDDCDGKTDSNDVDASNSCPISGQLASAVCQVDTCVVAACSGAWLNCDSAYNCETDGSSDLDHCGSCNNSCQFDCLSSNCDELVQLTAGSEHSCGLTSAGRVACWGSNLHHQVATANDDPILGPRLVGAVSGAKLVAAGKNHSCAIAGAQNQVWCWGDNQSAQLAYPTPTSPPSYRDPALVDEGTLTGATDLAGGGFHTCAVVANGEVRCWGRRQEGQVGNGSTASSGVPNATAVKLSGSGPNLSGVVQVVAGEAHTCARTSGGTVYCWGDNSAGQLGTGGASTHPYATQLSDLSGVSMLAAGLAHTCAVRSGSVLCWGDNSQKQLGQSSGATYTTPTAVSGLSDAIAVATGDFHTCATRSGGSVVCWGSNQAGERGDSAPATASASRVTVTGLSTARVASGAAHNCALGSNGAGVCWGNNLSGRLGNGDVASTHLIQTIQPLQ